MIQELFHPNGLFNVKKLTNSSLRQKNIKAIRSLSQSIHLSNNLSVCRVLGNYLMFVSTLDERHGIQLQMNGFWEMGVTEVIAQTIKPGMRVMDVGANYGYFTFLMAQLVGHKGQVCSIEANPFIFELICKSIKINGYKSIITPLNLAVSDCCKKQQPFVFSDSIPMNGALKENKTERSLSKKFTEQVMIDIFSLDSIPFAKKGLDLIKIDIEGSEDKFWYGSKTVRKNNPDLIIIMEFNRLKYESSDTFIDCIYQEGYQVFMITTQGMIGVEKQKLMNSPTNKHMMLFIKKA